MALLLLVNNINKVLTVIIWLCGLTSTSHFKPIYGREYMLAWYNIKKLFDGNYGEIAIFIHIYIYGIKIFYLLT